VKTMVGAAIEVRDLRHRYGRREVLAIPHWRAEHASHWALLGVSGSGKSTLLHIFAGLLRPTQGEVTVAGASINSASASELDLFRARLLGFVPQRAHLLGHLRVEQNLALAQRFAGVATDFMRIHDVLWKVGLKAQARAYPSELSRGQAQRVAIARAVLNRPKVLLADEPTANLDDEQAAAALDLLSQQALDCGATLVVATHDQRVKARLTNHMTLAAPVRDPEAL
jgi:putative ABC transport system ATP-binding protein